MPAEISSITGLQNLSNLQDFRADWNCLVSVDLSGLTNLTYVDISDCDDIVTNDPSLTSVNLTGCTSLADIRIDDSDFSGGIPNLTGLNALEYVDLDQCEIAGSLDLSFLPSLQGFDVSGNTGLTSVTLSSSQPLGGRGINLAGCALTLEAVRHIFVTIDESGQENGNLDIDGGTNASPSGDTESEDAIQSLQAKGWSMYYN